MSHVTRLRMLVLAAVTFAGSVASAAPELCVPSATGVPTRPGPPRWLDWSGTPTVFVDPALDDPRWSGAAGHSYSFGSARAPLLFRALWAGEGRRSYLYLSFIVDLEGYESTGAATPRDLFLGFRRPQPFAGPGGAEHAYIFQFHLTSGSASTMVAPRHCSHSSSCSEASGTQGDFWRAFVDRGNTGTCDNTSGELFERFTSLASTSDQHDPPITWMTGSTDPGLDAVRYWKLGASGAELLQHRWAVQIRLPIAPGNDRSLEEGIPPGATFWYQGTAALTGGGGNYAPIGSWPSTSSEAICPVSAAVDFLVHPQLGAPGAWGRISRYSGTPPPTCAGLTIRPANIGAVFDAPPGTDFSTVTPSASFLARSDGTPAANTVVAQVVNLGPAPVEAPIMARFRLASWGSAPVAGGDLGNWKDLRGAERGVCGVGAPPSCALPPPAPPFRIPFVDANGDGQADPGTNNRAAITFRWTIGTDPTIRASEYCKFGLTPPGTPPPGRPPCEPCSCATAPTCDLESDAGTRATVDAAAPCVSAYGGHQCLLVELSAPNGKVDFVQQSAWNNMNFAQMSTVAREALIDARRLPVGKDQKYQDIYLIAMARNMPKAIPGGAQTGTSYLHDRTLARIEQLGAAYRKDRARLSPRQLDELMQALGRGAGDRKLAPPPWDPIPCNPRDPGCLGGPGLPPGTSIPCNPRDPGCLGGPGLPPDPLGKHRERIEKLRPQLELMPDRDLDLARRLIRVVKPASAEALTRDVVGELGPVEAARVVPTLEIYPFYRPLDAGNAYLPMTAFTVFLSHEGSMNGMTWQIDGATRVGENIYHLRIPVRHARRIQVRAQALSGTDPPLGPSNPKWPCAAGCCVKNCGLVAGTGNLLPGLLASLYVVLRGRRRRRPAPTPMP